MAPGFRYYANKYPRPCEFCDQTVPANAGRVRRTRDGRWIASHIPKHWEGSPISGRVVGGCPDRPRPEPDTSTDPAPAAPTPTPEQARVILYRWFSVSDGTPPRYLDPGTDQGRERLDADCVRLASMNPLDLALDAEAMATYLEIVQHQRWDG